jgi:hypothetical protein
MRRIRISLSVLLALFAWFAGVIPVEAQLNAQHIKSTVGLKAGSQPGAGISDLRDLRPDRPV